MIENTLKFDDSKGMESFFDFHDTQILKINTSDSNLFLIEAKKFDQEVLKRVDDKGRCRLLYIIDKVPPLTAILSFIQSPFDQVKWGVYAAIAPSDESMMMKFEPVVTYGLGITQLRDKFVLKIFGHEHRQDLTEILKWMDANMEPPQQEQEQEQVQGEEQDKG